MKVCSVCRQCYDDSVINCSADDNGSLNRMRDGDRRLVEGYEFDFRIEPDSPFELYKATHSDSKKSVLIRFIKTSDSSDELQKEIESVAAINHPNLARVYEFGKISGDELYVVLEDVSDKNLRAFLEKTSPLKERYAIKIARQIAEGLEELHSKNIVHRAVNPSNIYFTNSENNDFEVKLQNYDFGGTVEKKVVKGANGIDAKTEIFRYYSPEQFTAKEVDFKSDIYSLAVVFYETLLDSSPYDALNPQAIENFIFNESDTEKLHFDLRALLAYTLHQSLQHKLHLRPPTTNNLARQYRHLELVATPPEIGLQKSKAEQPKQRKNISGYQTDKAAVKESTVETEVSAPEETVEFEFQPQAVQITVQQDEIKADDFEAEKISELPFVEQKAELADDLPVEAAADLPQTEIQNLTVEEIPIEDENAESIEFSEISEELSKSDSFDLTEEFDSVEEENFSQEIHITNRDFADEIEPEIYFSEPVEFAEPEFVEDPFKKESPSDRHIMNSLGTYNQSQSFGKNKIYAVTTAVLLLLVFGVFILAKISNSAGVETYSTAKPPLLPANVSAEKKQNEIADDTKPLLINKQNSDRNEIEFPKTDQAVIEKKSSDSLTKSEKIKPQTTIDEKNFKQSAEKNKSQIQSIKKESGKLQQSRRNKTETKKGVPEKIKPSTNSAAGMTRPRIVTNVKPKD